MSRPIQLSFPRHKLLSHLGIHRRHALFYTRIFLSMTTLSSLLERPMFHADSCDRTRISGPLP